MSRHLWLPSVRLGPSVTRPSTKAEFHPASFWMNLIFKIFKPPPLFSVSTCYCNLIIKRKKKLENVIQREIPSRALRQKEKTSCRTGVVTCLLLWGCPTQPYLHPSLPSTDQPDPCMARTARAKSRWIPFHLPHHQLSPYSRIFITWDDARGRETQLGLWVQVQVSFWLFQKSYFDVKPV